MKISSKFIYGTRAIYQKKISNNPESVSLPLKFPLTHFPDKKEWSSPKVWDAYLTPDKLADRAIFVEAMLLFRPNFQQRVLQKNVYKSQKETKNIVDEVRT